MQLAGRTTRKTTAGVLLSCARLKSLEAGLGDKPRAWLASRTKAYK